MRESEKKSVNKKERREKKMKREERERKEGGNLLSEHREHQE